MSKRLLWLVVLVPACRVASGYAGAAIFAGTALGATAVNRSLTGECWAACSKGWHCNHDSGLCDQDLTEPGVHEIRRHPAERADAAAGEALPRRSDDAGGEPDAAEADAADAEPGVPK